MRDTAPARATTSIRFAWLTAWRAVCRSERSYASFPRFNLEASGNVAAAALAQFASTTAAAHDDEALFTYTDASGDAGEPSAAWVAQWRFLFAAARGDATEVCVRGVTAHSHLPHRTSSLRGACCSCSRPTPACDE
jgi:hypothetical protein